MYVGKYIQVEGDQDSTNLQTGSLRVKGGRENYSQCRTKG